VRQIDDFFTSEPRQTLYHYTGIGSLMGMDKSNSLWASNIYYLNDSKEIVHACEALENVLRPRFVFDDKQDPENVFLEQFQAWVNDCKNTNFNIFIFSLSEEPSLLSQWRSYTPHGKGVSIGISPETLTNIKNHANLRFAKCLYENHEQEEALGSLIEKMLITFRRELPNIDTSKAHPSQCYHAFLEGFRGDVLQVLSIIKHRAFKEEKEWRLISQYYPKYTIPEIKFREGASMIIPYIELSLGESNPKFENIILGPSPHQNLSMQALSMYLSNRRVCNYVENCSIPYREW
jgi:hypothetical protein